MSKESKKESKKKRLAFSIPLEKRTDTTFGTRKVNEKSFGFQHFSGKELTLPDCRLAVSEAHQ